MKILQLVTKRQYRGAEVFAANLSLELIKLGHEIFFVGLYENKKNVLIVDKAENIDLVQDKTGLFSTNLVGKIVKLIKKTKPDVIQCNGSDTLKYMFAASFFLPAIPIVYRNISMISEWVPQGPKKMLYKKMFSRISHVSSVGENAIEDFVRTFNYPEDQTSVVRRGIPIEQIEKPLARKTLRKELNLEESDKVVIHVGNFSPEKNHTFLLDIFSRLSHEAPHIKLVLVGDGILLDSINKEIIDRNLDNTVFSLGFRKDIPELLAASDCLVLCSKVEGVPGVILEAATQQVPAIATNVGGVKEVLIENFDLESFLSRIKELIVNDELRKQLGENAYKLVLEEYNPVKNAMKFEKLYLTLSQ